MRTLTTLAAVAAAGILLAGCGSGEDLAETDQTFIDRLPSFWDGISSDEAIKLGHDLCDDLDKGQSHSDISRMMSVAGIPASARSRTIDASILTYCIEHF